MTESMSDVMVLLGFEPWLVGLYHSALSTMLQKCLATIYDIDHMLLFDTLQKHRYEVTYCLSPPP